MPSSTFSHITVPLNLEGGEGNNTLRIDDRQRRLSRPIDINQTNYQIEYDQFHASTIYEADDDAAFQFNDVELQSVQLSDDPTGFNNVNIVSLGDPSDDSYSSDFVDPFAIYGYESLDRFTLIPHDSQGNATLLRPIRIQWWQQHRSIGYQRYQFIPTDDIYSWRRQWLCVFVSSIHWRHYSRSS